MNEQPEALLRHVFDAAVTAAAPARCVPQHLPAPPKGKTVVVGAGKAVAAMAKAVEDHYPAEVFGMVVTRYGHAGPTLAAPRCSRPDILCPMRRECGHRSGSCRWHVTLVRIICCWC